MRPTSGDSQIRLVVSLVIGMSRRDGAGDTGQDGVACVMEVESDRTRKESAGSGTRVPCPDLFSELSVCPDSRGCTQYSVFIRIFLPKQKNAAKAAGGSITNATDKVAALDQELGEV